MTSGHNIIKQPGETPEMHSKSQLKRLVVQDAIAPAQRIFDLERQLAEALQRESNAMRTLTEAVRVNKSLLGQIEKLERGEYICQKCGLRKNAEFKPGDF